MECNRESAERLRELAKTAEPPERAVVLLEKALRLFPLEGLLADIAVAKAAATRAAREKAAEQPSGGSEQQPRSSSSTHTCDTTRPSEPAISQVSLPAPVSGYICLPCAITAAQSIARALSAAPAVHSPPPTLNLRASVELCVAGGG